MVNAHYAKLLIYQWPHSNQLHWDHFTIRTKNTCNVYVLLWKMIIKCKFAQWCYQNFHKASWWNLKSRKLMVKNGQSKTSKGCWRDTSMLKKLVTFRQSWFKNLMNHQDLQSQTKYIHTTQTWSIQEKAYYLTNNKNWDLEEIASFAMMSNIGVVNAVDTLTSNPTENN